MNREKLKFYFLGKLPEAENDSFEQEIALDAQLTETARVVESELIDDYLRGNLSASDRELFEGGYLNGETRREKLLFAKSLWQMANEPAILEITAAGAEEKSPSFWHNWRTRRLAFAGAAAAAVLLLIGAFVFLLLNPRGKMELVQQQNSNQTPISNVEDRNPPPVENANVAPQTAGNFNLPQNKTIAPAPVPKTTPKPAPIKPSAPTFASFTLSPGTLRDAGEQFIKIAGGAQKINLRLKSPADASSKYQMYSAVIKTADGETIFAASNLKSLNLVVPTAKLENRTYIIFLEGQNARHPSEPVAEYTFRVRR